MTVPARARRYVSAPAGTYPGPVLPVRDADPISAAVLDEEPVAFDEDVPEVSLSMATPALEAADPAATILAHAPQLRGPYREPDLDEVAAEPASPAFGALPDDDFGRGPESHDPLGDGFDRLAAEAPPAGWARRGRNRMILGAVAGLVVGVVVAVVLLALSRPEGISLALNPVSLWDTVNDQMKLMAALVAAGFGLLGTALGARGAAER